MEDCERKYKEAFNMAVLEHKSDNEAVRESIERIFPQLKEPEDERIRKALISAINNICNGDKGLVTFNGFSKEQVLTWLEKQGEQKSADKCEGCNNAKGCVACVDGSEWAHIEEQKPAWSEEDEKIGKVIDLLGTIEVKKVDLDESARNYLLHEHVSPLNEVLHQADLKVEMQYHKDIEDAYKAGFELGLKAKGE